MPLVTAPLARFVEASGQLRAAWYDAKAYYSENVDEVAAGSDQLQKLESAEELVEEAVSSAESTLKACAKLCTATRSSGSSAIPIASQSGDRRENKERPWAAASHHSRQIRQTESPQPPPRTGQRKYEAVDSDWSSWKRAEPSKGKQICKFHQQGRCLKGDKCAYSHEVIEQNGTGKHSKWSEPGQIKQTLKRKYEDADSEWSSWKRAEQSQQSKWPETEPLGNRAAPISRKKEIRLAIERSGRRPRTQAEWGALNRSLGPPKIYAGQISVEELHDNILPERLPSFPQDRLCDLLQDSIEKWLKKRNRNDKKDVVTIPLESIWRSQGGSGKFKAVFPLIDPPITSLADWVSENMDDTTVGVDENGDTTLSRRRPDENDEEEQERYQELLREFLGSLPEHSLTDEEEDLRIALLSYLEEWDGDSPPQVECAYAADNERSLEVYLCKWLFLPRRIKLRDWISNRIGREIEVLEDEAGSFVFQLSSEPSE